MGVFFHHGIFLTLMLFLIHSNYTKSNTGTQVWVRNVHLDTLIGFKASACHSGFPPHPPDATNDLFSFPFSFFLFLQRLFLLILESKRDSAQPNLSTLLPRLDDFILYLVSSGVPETVLLPLQCSVHQREMSESARL